MRCRKAAQKLTLDRPVTYEIKVPGHLDERWTEWDGEIGVTIENAEDGQPITVIMRRNRRSSRPAKGLLRRLYALGLPLISVNLRQMH